MEDIETNPPETVPPPVPGWATVEQWRAEKQREGRLRTAALQLICVLTPTDWSYIFGHPKYGEMALRITEGMKRVEDALLAYEGKLPNQVGYAETISYNIPRAGL